MTTLGAHVKISNLKITHLAAGAFLRTYYDLKAQSIGTARKWFDIRIGQAFCNEYNITDSELFYASNDRAVKIIYERYVD